MSTATATTLAALALFAAFHLPLPMRLGRRWVARQLRGVPAMVCGIGYHLLLLPAVAGLPAPEEATAAGYAWMFLDVMLDGAELGGSTIQARPLRDAVHIISSVWLLSAGWTAGPALGLIGTALAGAFLVRLSRAAAGAPIPAALLHASAALNVLWMAGVAVTLW